jgi:hypothetical protein
MWSLVFLAWLFKPIRRAVADLVRDVIDGHVWAYEVLRDRHRANQARTRFVKAYARGGGRPHGVMVIQTSGLEPGYVPPSASLIGGWSGPPWPALPELDEHLADDRQIVGALNDIEAWQRKANDRERWAYEVIARPHLVPFDAPGEVVRQWGGQTLCETELAGALHKYHPAYRVSMYYDTSRDVYRVRFRERGSPQ